MKQFTPTGIKIKNLCTYFHKLVFLCCVILGDEIFAEKVIMIAKKQDGNNNAMQSRKKGEI